MASNVLNDGDEAASLLTGSAPLSLSPLPANVDAKRRSTASSAGGEHGGNARRPRLEELLRIESSSKPPEFNTAEPADMMAHGHGSLSEDGYFSKESGGGGDGEGDAIVVFDFPEDETSRDDEEYVLLTPCNEEQQTVDMMAPLDYLDVVGDKPAPEACGGAAGHVVSLTVLVNMKRIGLLFAALREHSRALKGSYRRQAAGRRADGHAELFYHRPIALGRRCRVQHQPE